MKTVHTQRPRWKWTAVAFLFPFILQLVGCVEISAVAGTDTDLGRIDERLVMGVSTEREVVGILGRPYGRGREWAPPSDQPRDVLTYYYEVSDLKETTREFLFVFLEEGVFDGYLWFSNIPD